MTATSKNTIMPENSWELLRWLYFEPERIKAYESSLSTKEKIQVFLSLYWRWSIFVIVLWLITNWLIAYNEWITHYLQYFNPDFQKQWKSIPASWIPRFLFLAKFQVFDVVLGLVLGLAFGLILGLVRATGGLVFGLAFGLVFSLITGLAGGLASSLEDLAGDLIVVSAFSSAFGLAFGLASSFDFGRLVDLLRGSSYRSGLNRLIDLVLSTGFILLVFVGVFELVSALGEVFVKILLIVWVSGFTSSLTFYRIPNMVFYYFSSLFSRKNLLRNPYRSDALIWYPIYLLDQNLIRQAKEDPEQAEEFIAFLLERRKWQRPLAMKLRHAALAGTWYNTSLNLEQYDPGKNILSPPLIAEDQPKYQPSERWIQQLHLLRQKLSESLQENNLALRKDKYEEVVKVLQDFRRIHAAESPIWNQYYQDIFPKWEIETTEQFDELNKAAADIIKNPYQIGVALRPDKHAALFVGREDIRQQLEFEIRQAESLPLFLLQGQRRVGKTSVLNFLDDLLGKGYKVIRQDLQSAADMQDVKTWMQSLRKKVNNGFGIKEPSTWQATDNWLESWKELSDYLLEVSKAQLQKILVTIDEYEELHTRQLARYPEKGGHLLGAIRSFSQYQNQVIFFFSGTHLFSELESPRWADYFVQAKCIHIDYLTKEDSIQLLTCPYDNFPLHYPQELLDKIFNLTQGHPFLLQLIGYEMIKEANLRSFKFVSREALEYVIQEKVLQENIGVFEVFWGQFCENPSMKATVTAIIQNGYSSDEDSLRRLLRHGFIERVEAGKYQIRVPLFEQWVRKFYLEYF